MNSCHGPACGSDQGIPSDGEITVALVGNPNVGKSTLFHKVTGIGVTISNYPGTTVEVAQGEVEFDGRDLEIRDLPGVYSLSASSDDERVTRRSLLNDEADVILNVLDASNLERNLYLTLQLLQLGIPTVVALNQYDRALKNGHRIDAEKLSERLGVPVVPTVASQGENVRELMSAAVDAASSGPLTERPHLGDDLERVLEELSSTIEEELNGEFCMDSHALSLILLQDDEDLRNDVRSIDGGAAVLKRTLDIASGIEGEHGEAANLWVAREVHGLASVTADLVTTHEETRMPFSEKLSRWTTQVHTGVPILAGVFLGLLGLLFYGGGFIESVLVGNWETQVAPILRSTFQAVAPHPAVAEILDIGINMGMQGILATMFPYILVFFLALAVLEDSGYLPRMAYVMDSAMHRIGLHGRAAVPMLGGFGCNVPAIMATRSLDTRRQRFISSFLITMVPCSARTAVILGTVGVFVGMFPALAIYGIVLLLIFLVGLALNRGLKGESSGMVMEMPPLRAPQPKPVLSKTWNRMREFLYVAVPLLLVGSFVIGILEASGVMDAIVSPLAPITLGIMGLPPLVIVPLLYGVVRKEGALVLLVAVAGTSDLTTFMSPLQLFVFALVVSIYIPCIATFAVLKKELGRRDAIGVTAVTITLAVVVGGLIYRVNPLGLAG